MFFIILICTSLLPSLILAILGAWAYKRKSESLYFNLSFASFCSSTVLTVFLIWFFHANRQQDAQDGIAILASPVIAFIFGIGAFLAGFIINPFVIFEKTRRIQRTELATYPFWIAIASMICFVLIWLFQIPNLLTNKD